mgnify:FL=1
MVYGLTNLRTDTRLVYTFHLYSLKLIHIMSNFILENWIAILIGALAFIKIIVNLTPTEKDNKIFGYIDDLVNFFIKDQKK